jgi:hypothetical protein
MNMGKFRTLFKKDVLPKTRVFLLHQFSLGCRVRQSTTGFSLSGKDKGVKTAWIWIQKTKLGRESRLFSYKAKARALGPLVASGLNCKSNTSPGLGLQTQVKRGNVERCPSFSLNNHN